MPIRSNNWTFLLLKTPQYVNDPSYQKLNFNTFNESLTNQSILNICKCSANLTGKQLICLLVLYHVIEKAWKGTYVAKIKWVFDFFFFHQSLFGDYLLVLNQAINYLMMFLDG